MSPKKEKKTVLIIEDDIVLRNIMVLTLKQKGIHVVEATTGKEGLTMVKSVKPDLILLDLILPEVGGFEILTKIKEDEDTSAIPVFILSNFGQKDDLEKGVAMGAEKYLIKAHQSPKEIVQLILDRLDTVA